ncbi:MAG: Glu-tRNA(Gln) amidotransferase subunit GatE [Nitrosopumilaceae archaeon]|nr:Glu-tRNA(Gln) amidotransferase subunit GatE [Nitrosopumilaceae archaeon]NIU00247.1 Glu-tRNA(Gln) amidotransferase subunit GatE [Nitrosopumilaceae archaeon]NIU86659.1 Glu-tRNA(Gln) amidotransferase subunit GatE [Nitrosopumilaceae archaeon]NIV65354.1 Glu-tRNA(Gln) amidotransferase subunit GatE [Nitrosopumilaceae archaeon]NIX60849.1 Glu-tRNA(Gln) amidotransferase subunit GatE [Nitrosopumilaceae archaeon]
MPEPSYKDLGLKVGLEIHQQLDTNKKLFCNCIPQEFEEYPIKFQRKLRASKSELGEYDPAALFENAKSKTIMYYANPQSSCLVELDEEPPHNIDDDAKKIALLVSLMLDSKVFPEIFPMRKMVVDGSNTTGFQRTMLIAQGGSFVVDSRNVEVQSICLEEDAGKLLGDKEEFREFSLDRLGTPLIEIALEPLETEPSEIRRVARSLGRLLRTTRMVSRGLGSIRQDVNVSIKGGQVVEVKGVQQLDQLEKTVEFEAKRQYGLWKIAEKLESHDYKISKVDDVFNVTDQLKSCNSKIIKNSIEKNEIVKAIRIRNFSGMFTYSPINDIRIGKEIGQLVRFFGIGGVFHSDELPKYGIEDSDVQAIRKKLNLNDDDAFLIIAGDKIRLDYAINSIIDRLDQAKGGVVAETRMATSTGETVYLRPRPGASRMYPETDISPIKVTKEELDEIKKEIPKSWEESVKGLQEKYQMNKQLAEQVFDSEYLELFEKVCKTYKVNPNYVASTFCSTITSLERKGLNRKLLSDQNILRLFSLLDNDKITKESTESILEDIMAGNSKSVDESLENMSVSAMDDHKVEGVLDQIVQDNQDLIKKQGSHAIGPLMGIAMKSLRGKASGKKINEYLIKKINKA